MMEMTVITLRLSDSTCRSRIERSRGSAASRARTNSMVNTWAGDASSVPMICDADRCSAAASLLRCSGHWDKQGDEQTLCSTFFYREQMMRVKSIADTLDPKFCSWWCKQIIRHNNFGNFSVGAIFLDTAHTSLSPRRRRPHRPAAPRRLVRSARAECGRESTTARSVRPRCLGGRPTADG